MGHRTLPRCCASFRRIHRPELASVPVRCRRCAMQAASSAGSDQAHPPVDERGPGLDFASRRASTEPGAAGWKTLGLVSWLAAMDRYSRLNR